MKEREKNDKTTERKHNILVQKKMAQDENYKQVNRNCISGSTATM